MTENMRNVTVRMPDSLIEALEAEADEKGVDRSTYIRQILERREESQPDLERRLSRVERELEQVQRELDME